MKAFLILFLSSAVYADFINTNVNLNPGTTGNTFTTKLEKSGLLLYSSNVMSIQQNSGLSSSFLFNISSNQWTNNFVPCFSQIVSQTITIGAHIVGITSLEEFNVFKALCMYYNINANSYSYKLFTYYANNNSWTSVQINLPNIQSTVSLNVNYAVSYFQSISFNTTAYFFGVPVSIILNSSGSFLINTNFNINTQSSVGFVEKQKLLVTAFYYQTPFLQFFDYQTNIVTNPPFNRYATSVYVLQSKSQVFLAGGSGDQNCNFPSNKVDVYDVNTKIFTSFFLSTPRCNIMTNAISNSGLIFFAGGVINNYQNLLNIIDILDVNTNSMTTSQLTSGGNVLNAIEFKSFVFFLNKQWILNLYSNCVGGIGVINPTSCLQCTAGFYCPLYSTTANQIACPKGSYCPAGSSSALISPTGTYNPNIQMSAPMICPAGYYCPQGTINPLGCTQGSYCPAGSGSPTSCPTGTYNNQVNSSSISDCLLCPTGTYNNFGTGGLTICKPCSRGYYCPPGTSLPQPCGSNYYCPDGQNLVSCPAGTFYDGVSASDVSFCKSCPKGYYCAGKGTTAITCTPGTYTDEEKSAQCKTCPEGYYCQFGSTTPIICQMNTFADKGSPACTNCPNGQFTSGIGASACETCPSSKFSIDGWWCMSQYEKIVFLGIWIGSFISGLFTLWKVRNFYLDRKIKIIENGLKPSIKTFLFLEIILKNKARRNAELTNLENDNKPILDEDKEKNKKIEETIIFLQSIKS